MNAQHRRYLREISPIDRIRGEQETIFRRNLSQSGAHALFNEQGGFSFGQIARRELEADRAEALFQADKAPLRTEPVGIGLIESCFQPVLERSSAGIRDEFRRSAIKIGPKALRQFAAYCFIRARDANG